MTDKDVAVPREHHEHGQDCGSGAGAGSRLLLAMVLTGSICAVEAIGGLWTGCLALLSDAAHVFLDAVALGMSYFALRLAALPPNPRHSYGYRRAEVLAALANAITLSTTRPCRWSARAADRGASSV